MTKVQYDKCRIWQRYNMTKVQFDKCRIWQRYKMTKVQYDKGTIQQRYNTTKVQYDKGTIWKSYNMTKATIWQKLQYKKGTITHSYNMTKATIWQRVQYKKGTVTHRYNTYIGHNKAFPLPHVCYVPDLQLCYFLCPAVHHLPHPYYVVPVQPFHSSLFIVYYSLSILVTSHCTVHCFLLTLALPVYYSSSTQAVYPLTMFCLSSPIGSVLHIISSLLEQHWQIGSSMQPLS